MSRLYEALSRMTIEQRQSDAAPASVAPLDEVRPARIPINVVPPQPAKTEEVLSEVRWKPAEAKERSDETGSVTARASLASRLVALTDPHSLGGEKFRVLVARLDHLRKQRELKSLQLTSSVVNEGKTVVAANLAVTLAKYAGSRTLLVEGDLHRPALASLFGLGELRGLSHWWSGSDHDVAHFLYRFDDIPLWFLPAGKAYDQPSDILRSGRFADAFAQLANRFDWIVVDSTPMLPIVDANLWSRLVDGTLLVVREGLAPVKALKKGLQALDHPKLIGVVMNEASEFDQESYKVQYYGARKH